jgi:multidrug resistance efflux pump
MESSIMSPTRQSRRELSLVPTRVSERAEDTTQPVLRFGAFAQNAMPVSASRQTMVGVGRLLDGFVPVAAPSAEVARAPRAASAPVERAAHGTLVARRSAVASASRPKHEAVASPGAPPAAAQPTVARPAAQQRAAQQPAASPRPAAPVAPPELEPISRETGLFRKAAVEARRADGVGVDFSTGVKSKSWSMLLLLLSFVGLLFAGAALASIEVTAEAQGVLRAPNGLRPVASVLAGSITEVLVRGGDAVEPGQVVARLESTELRTSLDSRLRELEIVREDVTRSEQHDRKIETQSASANQRRRAALRARVDLNEERLKQRRTQHADVDTLVREGGASRVEGMNAKEALQEASEQVSSLSLELAVLDLEIADRARLAQERQSTRHTQLSRAEAGANEARSLLAASEIRSPAAGRIESLLVAPGAVVPAGGVLGNIVPSSAPRSIVGFVPSREIAFIQAGAPATVEVQSLPVSEFGLGKARVTRVSADVATAAEVQNLLGEAPTGPLVRVELELIESESSPKMDALLRSGERVKVRLHRRERRLITLLFDFVQRWVQ